mmetsp:Transcript_42968/g.124258  ORF Transcript_42968/g.124258 Transcript_42968/m.124258 type:complete len:607 (-) Transcript_42968:117-1937(-)
MWQIGRDPEPHRRALPDADEELRILKSRELGASAAAVGSTFKLSAATAAAVAAKRPDSAGHHSSGGFFRGNDGVGPGASWTSVDPSARAYHWTANHVHHDQPLALAATLADHGTGAYVKTLTMPLRKETIAGASAHMFRLSDKGFSATSAPWCHVIKGSVPCVVMTGSVVCTSELPEKRNDRAVIGTLPAEARPGRLLRFAACAAEPPDERGAAGCKLVTIECQADGVVMVYSGNKTKDSVKVGSTIDLSGIRFCRGNGISLIDDVLLYLCDFKGTRIVCLQGDVGERYFNAAARTPHNNCLTKPHAHTEYGTAGRKALALLPSSGQPPRETYFVTAGGAEGGYHLLLARPDGEGRLVGSGDIIWQDGSWHRDVIHLDGLMWEATPEAMMVANPMCASRANESQVILVMDFRRYLIRRFGSVEEAWHAAFDTDKSGYVNFTEFGIGCKAAGFVGNVTKLWAALDADRSGILSIAEMDPDTDAMMRVARADRARQIEESRSNEAQLPPRPSTTDAGVVSRGFSTGRWANQGALARLSARPSPRVRPLQVMQRSLDRRREAAPPPPGMKTSMDFLTEGRGPPPRPSSVFSARHSAWVGQPLARPQSTR